MRMLLATLARLEGSADGPRYRAGLAERLQIVAVPPAGAIRPSGIRSMVVLPAPFGPRNPVTVPAPAQKLTSSTASTGPKHLVSPHTSITLTVPPPGCCRARVVMDVSAAR
jgi:hypothetical protein